MEAQPSVWTGFGSSLAVSFASFGLVCFGAWVFFRWLAFRARGGASRNGGLKLRAKLVLEPRRAVYLIEVGARAFLIGGGETGLSLLAELAPADVPVDSTAAGEEVTPSLWWARLFGSQRNGSASARGRGWSETLSEAPERPSGEKKNAFPGAGPATPVSTGDEGSS